MCGLLWGLVALWGCMVLLYDVLWYGVLYSLVVCEHTKL